MVIYTATRTHIGKKPTKLQVFLGFLYSKATIVCNDKHISTGLMVVPSWSLQYHENTCWWETCTITSAVRITYSTKTIVCNDKLMSTVPMVACTQNLQGHESIICLNGGMDSGSSLPTFFIVTNLWSLSQWCHTLGIFTAMRASILVRNLRHYRHWKNLPVLQTGLFVMKNIFSLSQLWHTFIFLQWKLWRANSAKNRKVTCWQGST